MSGWSGSGEGPPQISTGLLYPHMAERASFPFRTLIQTLIPFTSLHAHDLVTSQRTHLLTPSPREWGCVGLQHMNMGEHTHLFPNTHPSWRQALIPSSHSVHPLHLSSVSPRLPGTGALPSLPISRSVLLLIHEMHGSTSPRILSYQSRQLPCSLLLLPCPPPGPSLELTNCQPCCWELLEETHHPTDWRLTLMLPSRLLCSWPAVPLTLQLFSTFSAFSQTFYPSNADIAT